MLGEEYALENDNDFSDLSEADDDKGLTTEQVILLSLPAYARQTINTQSIAVLAKYLDMLGCLQVTQLMDMLCNETDVAELDVEVSSLSCS